MRFLLFSVLVCIGSSIMAQHPCAEARLKALSSGPVASPALSSLESRYDVKFHHLNIDVERNNRYISGSVRTVVQAIGGTLDSFGFELHPNLIIDSVIQAGIPLPVTRSGNDALAELAIPVTAGGLVDLTIYYHGTPPTVSAAVGAGFSNQQSPSWGNQVTWSLSESFHAYEWWPCKQALQDKIDSSWCFITTDSTNKAGSNGVLTQVVKLGNGKARYEWKSHHPIDYYLISVAVAKYVEYKNYAHPQGYADSILIQNFIYNNPNTLPSVKAELDKMPALVELFSKLYGLYPFADEKYGHCMAPLSGGMEHQTMTTQGFFEFTIDAHELGHQWFGDNATCATWNDIYVNEGWASYSEYLALEYLTDTAQAQQHMRDVHSSVMSQTGGSIWFTDSTNENRIFDSRLSYDKGAAFNHMMRFEINNDSVFYLALQTYQQQYKNGTASAENFRSVIEAVTGIDLTQFYDQWFYGEGYPNFNVRYNYQNGVLYLRSAQSTSKPTVTPLFVTPIEYLIKRAGAPDTTIRVLHDQNTMNYAIPMAGTDVTGIIIDPQNWILNTVGLIIKDATLTSINDAKSELNLYVYPNPAADQIKLYGYDPSMSVSIYDQTGREVAATIQPNGIIDLRNSASGVYHIRVSAPAQGASQTLKFVKL